MVTIENDDILISVSPLGAELSALYSKKYSSDFLWSGDPAFWGKKSPVLFPIVGTLKNDTYYFEQKEYHLSRHGFARTMEFALDTESPSRIHCRLESNDETLKNFPFHFQFDISYCLERDRLMVEYKVLNKGDAPMYFSVGGHPAFCVPLTGTKTYNDYFLEFNRNENSGRWPISKEGLIEMEPIPMLIETSRLKLSKELFYQDAIVFKDLQSTSVKLKSGYAGPGLEFDFPGFPFLGIWAAKNADFVCIEPWCGIADEVESNQQLIKKEGINLLPAGEAFRREWSVRLF